MHPESAGICHPRASSCKDAARVFAILVHPDQKLKARAYQTCNPGSNLILFNPVD